MANTSLVVGKERDISLLEEIISGFVLLGCPADPLLPSQLGPAGV